MSPTNLKYRHLNVLAVLAKSAKDNNLTASNPRGQLYFTQLRSRVKVLSRVNLHGTLFYLESRDLVAGDWDEHDFPFARYYWITRKGQDELKRGSKGKWIPTKGA